MSYQINIGLPSFYEGIEIDEILSAIDCAGLDCERFEIYGPRLVAEVSVRHHTPAGIAGVLRGLAISLDREAIAGYETRLRVGQICGPKAHAYGPFNLAKFTRLSDALASAH